LWIVFVLRILFLCEHAHVELRLALRLRSILIIKQVNECVLDAFFPVFVDNLLNLFDAGLVLHVRDIDFSLMHKRLGCLEMSAAVQMRMERLWVLDNRQHFFPFRPWLYF
jgi:hypothetical protein